MIYSEAWLAFLPLLANFIWLAMLKLDITFSYQLSKSLGGRLINYGVLVIYLFYGIFKLLQTEQTSPNEETLFLGWMAINLLWLIGLVLDAQSSKKTIFTKGLSIFYFTSGMLCLLLVSMLSIVHEIGVISLLSSSNLKWVGMLLGSLSFFALCQSFHILKLSSATVAILLGIVGICLLSAYLAGLAVGAVDYLFNTNKYEMAVGSYFWAAWGCLMLIFAYAIKNIEPRRT
ncbi:MAG: hypothetical protein JJV97_04865 [SAR324 cluster bacterium]|nr:hypothetical protein [SAR324 cluster bacterium]